jgi:hypothetical protein
MSSHAAGSLTGGVEPPPDSTDPTCHSAINDGSSKTADRSVWVICPTFSSSVIRRSRSATRRFVGWPASR